MANALYNKLGLGRQDTRHVATASTRVGCPTSFNTTYLKGKSGKTEAPPRRGTPHPYKIKHASASVVMGDPRSFNQSMLTPPKYTEAFELAPRLTTRHSVDTAFSSYYKAPGEESSIKKVPSQIITAVKALWCYCCCCCVLVSMCVHIAAVAAAWWWWWWWWWWWCQRMFR